MHYVLYIPGERNGRTAEQLLLAVGCGHLLENAQAPQSIRGPDGEQGSLIVWMTNRNRIDKPDDHTALRWVPAKASDDFPKKRYYVGWDDASPPMPADIQRRYPFDGQFVTLGNGLQMLVPIAAKLPYLMVRDDDGRTLYIPQREFAEFYHESKEWQELIQSVKPGGHFLFESMRDYVEKGLRCNYRYLPELGDDLWQLWEYGANQSVERALRAAVTMTMPDLPGVET